VPSFLTLVLKLHSNKSLSFSFFFSAILLSLSSFVSFNGGNFFALASGADASGAGFGGVVLTFFEKPRIAFSSSDPFSKAHARAARVSGFTVPRLICPTICWNAASL